MVTASAGNHGRGLAYAAELLGLRLTVYVPRDAPRVKRDAIARHGAELKLVAGYDETEQAAKRHAASGDAIYISPYANADVIAGAGTIALEIFEDLPEVATIAVPVGGGGLASGIGIVARAVGGPRVIGVEASASPAFTTSLAAGRVTQIAPGPSIADGLDGEPRSRFDDVRAGPRYGSACRHRFRGRARWRRARPRGQRPSHRRRRRRRRGRGDSGWQVRRRSRSDRRRRFRCQHRSRPARAGSRAGH